jgi:hypothetical protein
MAQTPSHKIVSNISTYIPTFILEKLPSFIQDKSFDFYITIGAILYIITSFFTIKKVALSNKKH